MIIHSSEDLQRFNVLPLAALQCIVQAAIAIGRLAIQFIRVQYVFVLCNIALNKKHWSITNTSMIRSPTYQLAPDRHPRDRDGGADDDATAGDDGDAHSAAEHSLPDIRPVAAAATSQPPVAAGREPMPAADSTPCNRWWPPTPLSRPRNRNSARTLPRCWRPLPLRQPSAAASTRTDRSTESNRRQPLRCHNHCRQPQRPRT